MSDVPRKEPRRIRVCIRLLLGFALSLERRYFNPRERPHELWVTLEATSMYTVYTGARKVLTLGEAKGQYSSAARLFRRQRVYLIDRTTTGPAAVCFPTLGSWAALSSRQSVVLSFKVPRGPLASFISGAQQASARP